MLHHGTTAGSNTGIYWLQIHVEIMVIREPTQGETGKKFRSGARQPTTRENKLTLRLPSFAAGVTTHFDEKANSGQRDVVRKIYTPTPLVFHKMKTKSRKLLRNVLSGRSLQHYRCFTPFAEKKTNVCASSFFHFHLSSPLFLLRKYCTKITKSIRKK